MEIGERNIRNAKSSSINTVPLPIERFKHQRTLQTQIQDLPERIDGNGICGSRLHPES